MIQLKRNQLGMATKAGTYTVTTVLPNKVAQMFQTAFFCAMDRLAWNAFSHGIHKVTFEGLHLFFAELTTAW